MQITGLLTVRTGSSRLKNKCLLPFGTESTLSHLISRAKHFGIEPIISTTHKTIDDHIEQLAEKSHIAIYRGEEHDLLGRWWNTCKLYNIDKFVLLSGDNLFFDPDCAKNVYSLLDNEQHDFVLPPKTLPYIGCFTYGIRSWVLEHTIMSKSYNRNDHQWWKEIEKVPNIKIARCDFKESPNIGARLTLDYPEDYKLMSMVLSECGPFADHRQIRDYFSKYPDAVKINQGRNAEYLLGTGGVE